MKHKEHCNFESKIASLEEIGPFHIGEGEISGTIDFSTKEVFVSDGWNNCPTVPFTYCPICGVPLACEKRWSEMPKEDFGCFAENYFPGPAILSLDAVGAVEETAKLLEAIGRREEILIVVPSEHGKSFALTPKGTKKKLEQIQEAFEKMAKVGITAAEVGEELRLICPDLKDPIPIKPVKTANEKKQDKFRKNHYRKSKW